MAVPPNHSLPARRPLAREEELPRMKIPGHELRQVIASLVQLLVDLLTAGLHGSGVEENWTWDRG